MKKGLIISLLFTIMFCAYAQARTTYDKSGRIIKDSTVRGQRNAASQRTHYSNTAAAAKFDYDKALESLEKEPILKSNYYQDKNKNN